MCVSQCRKTRGDDVSVVKEEAKGDIPIMVVAEHARNIMKRTVADCSEGISYENNYNTGKQEARATSPLDTMAEVACRLGMELPLIAQLRSKESPLPARAFVPVSTLGSQERSSASPTSIPTQETINPIQATVSEPRKDSGHEASISLQSMLRMLRRYNSESAQDASCLVGKIDRNGTMNGAMSKRMPEQFFEELNVFRDGMMTALENIVQDMNKVKEEVVSLQRSFESLQERDVGEQDVVMVRPEDVGKVCFIVRPVEDCEEDHDAGKNNVFRFNGNKVVIHVERKCAGKCERALDDCMNSGNDAGALGSKQMRKIVSRKEIRRRPERGESMTESTCNSGKSDCDYTESGNKRSRNEGMGAKVLKGKGTKRRRDNWTEEENTVFTGIVLGNQETEEMTLRRMLARRFSPRRTHEQCANHLRILRAQKKLPPARHEAVTFVKKDSK